MGGEGGRETNRSNCVEFNGFEVNCAIKSREFVERVVKGLPKISGLQSHP